MAASESREPLGRSVLPVAASLITYLGAGTLIYWLFYSAYDDPAGAATEFKAIFMLLVTFHVALTVASSLLFSWLFKAAVLPALAITGLVVALAIVPSLGVLALVNDCLGVAFPWDGGCPH